MVNTMNSYPVGLCLQMCPEEEIKRRKEEKLLHRLETNSGKSNYLKVDVGKVIKCFSRSAADTLLSSPENLHPFKILCKTIFHLLNNTVNDCCVSLVERYYFIDDRLRAVRQDMIIQALQPSDCIVLLEPMIKFHLLFGYMFCEYPISVYDPILNNLHLMECLKQLLVCYDSLDDHNGGELIAEFDTLHLTDRECQIVSSDELVKVQLSRNRSFFETIYILLNLGNVSPLTRFLNIPSKYRSKLGKNAFDISVAYSKGLYVNVSHLMRKLPPLSLCAAAPQLHNLQKKALAIMSHAYNSKTLTFPKNVLIKSLLFNDSEELNQACDHFNIERKADCVIFNKSTFKFNIDAMKPSKLHFLDESLSHKAIDDLLLEECLVVQVVKL